MTQYYSKNIRGGMNMMVNTEQRAIRAGMNARKTGAFETEAPNMAVHLLDSFRKGWQLQNAIMLLGNPEERFLVKRSIDEIDLSEPTNKQCRPLQSRRVFIIHKRQQVILKTLAEYTGWSDHSVINQALDMLADVAISIKKQQEGKS